MELLKEKNINGAMEQGIPAVQKGEEMEEDKERILIELAQLLRLTRGGQNVSDIFYNKDEMGEWAIILYESLDRMTVNITADSGLAMISDVVKALT